MTHRIIAGIDGGDDGPYALVLIPHAQPPRLRLSRHALSQLLEKRWVVQLIGMLAGRAIEELRILAD